MIKMHVEKDTVHSLESRGGAKDAAWDFATGIASLYMMFYSANVKQAEMFKALVQASVSDLSPIWDMEHLKKGTGTFVTMQVPHSDTGSTDENAGENGKEN